MAVSILGKRSRRVLDEEDIDNCLPARKRATRNSLPLIYDEEQNHSKAESKARRSRHGGNTTIRNIGDDEIITEPTLLFQDENIPPSVTTTPSTIRVRDALGLKTPSTPRHRVKLAGFLRSTLSSPRSSIECKRQQSVFGQARQLFTPTDTAPKLVGRDAERQQLHHFIETAITTKTGGCIYVSGPPGTGKSAHAQDIIDTFRTCESVDVSVVNCVSLKSAAEVYGKLTEDFAPGTAINKSMLKQHLSKVFLGNSKTKLQLLLLDEIDSLLGIDCDVLYTIFEWALHRSSSLILVGIANALDLTDRFLPRLKARGLKPELLSFLPYNATQISNIIREKLRSLLPIESSADSAFVPFMQPAAVELCGKKIASQTGDLRKAFGLVRRLLDQIEKETTEKERGRSCQSQPLGEIRNIGAPVTPAATPSKSEAVSGKSDYTIETAPRVSIAHVARVSAAIFKNGTTSRLAGLNLQQRAVLCTLVSREKRKIERNPYVTPSKSANRIPTVKDLFAKYIALCNRDEGILHPLKDTEFRDVVSSLETLGLVHEQRGRTSSLLTPTSSGSRAGRSSDDKQFVSTVSETEMRESLTGPGADLLRRLLDEI